MGVDEAVPERLPMAKKGELAVEVEKTTVLSEMWKDGAKHLVETTLACSLETH